MKKIFLILLTLLFSTSLFADVNEPGSGCKWKMGGSDFYTDAGAAEMYEQTGSH